MVVGSLCYVTLFLTLSLFTRRALVLGIGYSLVWEGALSSLLPGIANLSVRQYALGAADSFYQLHTEAARLSPTTALTLSAILIVVALALATWRLMRFELSGSDRLIAPRFAPRRGPSRGRDPWPPTPRPAAPGC